MTKKSKKKSPKKNHKKNQKISKVKLLNIFLLVFLFAFLATGTSYFIMKSESSNKNTTEKIINDTVKTVEEKTKELQEFQKKKLDEYFSLVDNPKEAFEEYTEEFHKDYVDTETHKVQEQQEQRRIEQIKQQAPNEETHTKKEAISPAPKEEKKEQIVKQEPSVFIKPQEKPVKTYVHKKGEKPKIVIVIDDVSTKRQKNTILNIGYTVNMALLPPTRDHKNSAKIARDLPFYMIHFPMQATPKFKGAEIDTLKITDSYEKIEKRVKQLRAWYPNAKYTNNHTGSVFTQNHEAMDKLFRALKKYNFIFVDSRTTAKSVAKQMAKKYNMPYIVRNTFIDNKKDYNYIQNQLKKAIKIAKKRGYSIAIGHPYPITLKVLKESKHLLKGLEPIYLKDLPHL